MKLHLLLHSEQYDGETLLGIYDSFDKADQARNAYLAEDDFHDPELIHIVEVSMNDKADWNYTDPDLQAYYKEQLV